MGAAPFLSVRPRLYAWHVTTRCCAPHDLVSTVSPRNSRPLRVVSRRCVDAGWQRSLRLTEGGYQLKNSFYEDSAFAGPAFGAVGAGLDLPWVVTLTALTALLAWSFYRALATGSVQFMGENPTTADRPLFYWFVTASLGLLTVIAFFWAVRALFEPRYVESLFRI